MIRTKEAFFLLGVGGMGMSALANLLADRDDPVEGTDREYYRGRSLRLARRGVRVHPQGSGGLAAFLDAQARAGRKPRLLASPAVESDVPEMAEARVRGIVPESRVDFLTGLFNAAGCRVAVAGSAGKTTTAALLAHILVACGRDPSYAIGGYLGDAPNGRHGRSDLFLAEADESDGSVARYRPDLILFTNLFPEHRPLEELRENFRRLIENLSPRGLCLYAEMDPALGLSTRRKLSPVAGLLTPHAVGGESLELRYGRKLFRVPLAGAHNVRNVELAVAGANHLGVGVDEALRALEGFPGVEHRMSRAGEAAGVRVYCDFAHAPREIEASYGSARALGRRVVYVWQPHGFKPVAERRDELARVFGAMAPEDTLVLTDIYYGGGTTDRVVSGESLAGLAAAAHPNTHYVAALGDLPETVALAASADDVVILAGARTIFDHAERVLAALAGFAPSNGAPPETNLYLP